VIFILKVQAILEIQLFSISKIQAKNTVRYRRARELLFRLDYYSLTKTSMLLTKPPEAKIV